MEAIRERREEGEGKEKEEDSGRRGEGRVVAPKSWGIDAPAFTLAAIVLD